MKKSFSLVICMMGLLLAHGQNSFSFVQICDTQLGFGGYDHDLMALNQVVDQINLSEHAFAVVCGDLVNDADESSFADFKRIINRLKIPIHLAPGNHDVGGEPTDSTLHAYRKTIGPDYFRFDYQNHAFLVVNTQLWKVEVPLETKKHQEWFNSNLKEASDKKLPIYVIGHYPLYTEDPLEEEHYFNLPVTHRTDILKKFKDNGVRAYLSGHYHRRLLNTYEGILLVSGASCSKNFDDTPLGYRIWTITDGEVKHEYTALPGNLQHQQKQE